MTPVDANTLAAVLFPRLTAAGWTKPADPTSRALAVRGFLEIGVDHRRLIINEDGDDYPVNVLDALVTSVEQAVQYLIVAGALPDDEPIGYVVAIREHDRWTENWDGELHRRVELARRSRHDAEAGGYEAVVTELRAVTS